MIEAKSLAAWDDFVGSTALIAIIALAFCVMVQAVKPREVPRYAGLIVGIVILLVMLPAIIVSLWNAITFGQHLAIIAFGVAIVFLLSSSRRRPTNAKRR